MRVVCSHEKMRMDGLMELCDDDQVHEGLHREKTIHEAER